MKKFLAILLTLMLVFTFAACTNDEATGSPSNLETDTPDVVSPNEPEVVEPDAPVEPEVVDPAAKSEGVMTYAEYAAAELDTAVVIEAYVQATQSWWDNKITVYAQDPDGAYFIYELTCSEEDAAKLTKGTKIKVTGYKTEWSGEVEVASGATFEILEGNWVAEPTDVTALLGTDELITKQNMLASFKGMTIENISYKNDEPGDDIYVDVSLNGTTYSFCVERYLTGPETDVYKAFETLKAGDIVDIEGFLYWYNGVNTHITAISLAAAAE